MSHDGITEVGKYRVIEQIGEGAMGVVYRATDPVLNRTVAIKVMSDALARDDELRGRFLREAQAAGSLQHPNVITIYDFGEVDGHLFIAMEFVAGDDLESMLRNKAPMTTVQKIDIVVDVLSGLGYAHKRGVVHRDIKPANIRIDDDGRARIMDFGIAHLQSSKLTRTGLMVGTPAYMAPEQVTGGVITAQTDIFSAGAMMYELFTSHKPFEGESLQSVFYKIVTQPPPEFAAMAPNLPPSLNAIAMKALAKDPADRYATATDMAAALTEARAGLDRVSSQPKGLSLNSSIATGLRRTTKPMLVQRSRPQLIVAAAAGVLLLAASVGIIVTLTKRDSVQQVATAPTATPPNPQATAPSPVVAVAPPPTTVASPPTTPQLAGRGATPKTETSTPRRPTKSEPTAQELALVRNAQTVALEARRKASEAGATADQLRVGDDHSVAANTAALQGRPAEAATHLNLASTAWAAAEREARAATAAAAAAAKARVEAPKQEPVAPPAVVNPPVVVPQPVVSQPIVAKTPTPTPQVEIGALVTAYETAIASRDLAELRRAYPGMTAAQAKGWQDFFTTLRSIRADLAMSGLEIRGDAADARIAGAYDYVTTAGRSTRQPVTFQANFRREGGAWKLVAVR